MSRKQLKEVEANLEDLSSVVSRYIANKAVADEYKDLASDDNTKIKAMMETLGISECEDSEGENIATVSEQVKETFIEEGLIQYLKDNNYDTGIVKTREYIDMDALEAAIYHNLIPESIIKGMSGFKQTKVTKVLRIKKVKR